MDADTPALRLVKWFREHTQVLLDGRPVGELADEHAAWEATNPDRGPPCPGPMRWAFGHALVPVCLTCGACIWFLRGKADHREATWEDNKDALDP